MKITILFQAAISSQLEDYQKWLEDESMVFQWSAAKELWEFWGSLYFCCTVFTTIGKTQVATTFDEKTRQSLQLSATCQQIIPFSYLYSILFDANYNYMYMYLHTASLIPICVRSSEQISLYVSLLQVTATSSR